MNKHTSGKIPTVRHADKQAGDTGSLGGAHKKAPTHRGTASSGSAAGKTTTGSIGKGAGKGSTSSNGRGSAKADTSRGGSGRFASVSTGGGRFGTGKQTQVSSGGPAWMSTYTYASLNTAQRPSRPLIPIFYFWIVLVWLEVVFHISQFGGISVSIFYPLLFSLLLGTVLGIICWIFPPIVNRILIVVFTVFFCVLVSGEVVYYGVFSSYVQIFGVAGVAGQALDFMGTIMASIGENIVAVILLLILPVAFMVFALIRLVDCTPQRRAIAYIVSVAGAVVFYLLFILAIAIGGRDIYSAHDLYYDNLTTDNAIQTLGVTATTWASGRNALTGKTSTSAIYSGEDTEAEEEGEAEEEVTWDTSPNILEIDFDQIVEDSDYDENVMKLCDYIQDQKGTNKNKYTGMFAGYNLIWITAEGFDKYVVDKELTPTLYKMIHEGFYFRHYYSPEYYGSTSGGEWSNLTGTVPNDGSYVSMGESGKRGLDMLFTAGRQAKRLGYYTTGWHNNTYTYYDRDISFPNMGYEWYATGQGYEPEVDESGTALWPQSDRRLIKQSFPKYVDKEPFMTYYMSVSGHMNYDWAGNAMADRNRSKVKDLDYSETTKGYIAANLELEYALEDLMEDLEDAGIADRTAIVLAADHVPYDDMDCVEELAGKDLDYVEQYRNALIIYSPSMEEPVEVDKYCCSIDILPTVSNLMGWDYDSRMLVGKDILSDSKQFVMVPGQSFISDKCIYNAKTDKITYLTDDKKDVDEDYIKKMQRRAYNWYTISDLLFSTDFYKYVDKQMPKVSKATKKQIKQLRASPEAEAADEGESVDAEGKGDEDVGADVEAGSSEQVTETTG
ncbi:MAG: sulfatase-like hydrolase/transferase [Coriobacteriaceae bacterium]|nr:sulfatase-like hydrolase/transferase [Coriobacteriaceae bacterium]